MASPAAPSPEREPVPPPLDPQAIRACLTSALAAEFDDEWEITLELAKQSRDLSGVHDLVDKWRHIAYLEMCDPGAHHRILAKADQILRTGHNPDAASFEDMQALIQQRLGH